MKFLTSLALTCALVSALCLSTVNCGPPPMGRPPMGGPPMGGPPMGGLPMGGPPMGRPPMGGPPMGGPPMGGCPLVPPVNPNCRNTDTAANKKLVMDFYQEAFGDHNSANLEKYLSPNYIEHNPNEPDGIDAMRGLIDGPLAGSPKSKVDFKLAVAENDLVSLRTKLEFLGKIYATGDFFRIGCDGKIAEHWDAMQDVALIPSPAPNPHPFW